MVEIFSGSQETLKVAKNLRFRCCWSVLFCISGELTEINVQVQFRGIPPFKFHHLNGFYSANCPGVTQKLAHQLIECSSTAVHQIQKAYLVRKIKET